MLVMNSCENDEISNDSKKELKLDNFRNALSLSKIKLRETIGKLQSKKVKTSRSFAANDFGSFQEIEVIKSMNELECNKLLNPTLIASKELLYSYGLTENDLIEEKIDPNGSEMINYGIYLSVAEKELEESKTVAFDFKSLLGSEMYASKVGQCAGDALGISAVAAVLQQGFATEAAKKLLLKSLRKVVGRALGWVGAAIFVYEFSDCMGWIMQAGSPLPSGVESCNDLVMIQTNSSYFTIRYYFIAKSDISYKSASDFKFDTNRIYRNYDVEIGSNCKITLGDEFIHGSKFDSSTIKEINLEDWSK